MNKCCGRPVGWTGGEVKFCDVPIPNGTRFCHRCHLACIRDAAKRVEGLKMQLQQAEEYLARTIAEIAP